MLGKEKLISFKEEMVVVMLSIWDLTSEPRGDTLVCSCIKGMSEF